MVLTKHSTYKLTNGKEIPVIGFGTYQVPPESAESVVYHALETGYRHVDSAQRYGNERQVVSGILKFLAKDTSVKREEIFYTTKIDTINHGYETTKKSLDLSLADARELGYIDLVLIHDPLSDKRGRLASWMALQEYYQSGKVKAIGVSNYGLPHLKELLNSDVIDTKPQVHQISVNPWLYREDLINFSKNEGMLVEAYSSLTRTRKFDDEDLVKLAKSHGATPAQVLVRWSLSKGLLPLTKTMDPITKGKELMGSFDVSISDEDLDKLTHKDDYFLPEPQFDPPAETEHLGAINEVKP